MNEVGETTTVFSTEQPPIHGHALDKRSSIGTTLAGKVKPVEFNSRQLARDCLLLIGKELGN